MLISCSSDVKVIERAPVTETIYVAPKVVEVPSAPMMEPYNSRQSMDEINNFAKFQRNTLKLTDYIITLQHTINYYEEECSRVEQIRQAEKANSNIN